MDRPKLMINNIDISKRSPSSILETLLLCIDFQYSPEEVIKENIQSLFEMAGQYFTELKKISIDKTEKLECTKMLTTIKIWSEQIKSWSRDYMITSYWNFRMRNEKLSLLFGFGLAQVENNGEGGLKVRKMSFNPEKQLLRSLP